MYFSRILAVSLALLGAACGQSAHITLEPSDDLVEATQEAIEVWRPTLESCGRSLDIGSREPDAIIAYGDLVATQGSVAWTTYTHPHEVYLYAPELTDRASLIHVLSHELGHVLGAVESSNREDLMFNNPDGEPGLPGGTTPTANDAAQVCK